MSQSNNHPFKSQCKNAESSPSILLRGRRLCRWLRKTSATVVALFAASTMVFAQVAGPLSLQGTGGTITTGGGGGYVVHTFTTAQSGTNFVPPLGVTSVDVLIVGGGGGGGHGNTNGRGGGGGAGRYIAQTGVGVTAGVGITVTVGAGGAGGTSGGQGATGSASSFNGTTAGGGAGGGGGSTTAGVSGGSGGSGGGGGSSTSGNSAGSGGSAGAAVSNAGAGGRSSGGTNNRAGGGGGGSGAAGGSSPSNGNGGAGGAGTTPANWGLAVALAAGGGGSGNSSGGAGGSSSGGAGSTGTASGSNAAANTGSGGGGTRNATAGSGAGGVVKIRYLPPTFTITTQPSTSVGSGVVFPVQPQVTLLNGAGSGINGVQITAAIANGSATLGGTVTATTNASGVATFSGLSLTGSASSDNRISFVADGSTATLVSNNITIVSQSLAMSVQPTSSLERGVQFVQQPVILANNGSNVSGLTVTASIFSGGGTLGGTLTAVTDGSGLATFSDLAILGDPGARVLRFTATGWDSIDSNAVTTTASALEITQEPSATVTSGVLFPTQPLVTAIDGGGNAVSGVTITATVASGGGSLSGTVSRDTDGSGVATFDDLILTGSGAHTLNFAATNWTSDVSTSIDVQAAVQNLAMSVQPSATADLGVAFAQQPVVLADDGSPVSGLTITASIASGDGTLGGTLTAVTNGSGLATFSGLYITGTSGNHTLRFTAPAWSFVDSSTIAVQSEALTMSVQPSASAESAEQFPAQPAVRALDAAANPVEGIDITVAIQTGAGTLGGTLTATTNASGIATFTDLTITGALGDRTLRFTSPGWDSVDSNTVTVAASPLAITVQTSASIENGAVLAPSPVVQALDGAGDPVVGLSVTASILSGGGTLGGTVTRVTDGSGLATFDDLTITGVPGDRLLRFSATDWTATDSDTITIFSNLAIDTQPSASATSGFDFVQQPIIEALDGDSNPVVGLTVTAAIASGGGTLGGTLTAVTDGSGLASFGDLSITGSAGARTLEFTASGWGAVTSSAISVSAAPGACAYTGGLVGAQIVELVGCTTASVSGTTSVALDVPPGTAENDVLIAVISAQGNGLSVTGPAGWTEITDVGSGGGSNGVVLGVYTRIATGVELGAGSYTFTTSANADSYAYMMRFDNATGVVIEATETIGSSANATAPSLTTTVDNTLVVRLAAVAGTMTTDPATIITGHRNITQDTSGGGAGSAAYFNQETAGSTGTANFTHSSQRWVTHTIGLEPEDLYHFEITHAPSYGTCAASTPITINVKDSGGGDVTDYVGTVNLISSGGAGNYTLGTVAGTAGAFSNIGSGVASYEFNADNLGQVELNFTTTAVGNITFDASNATLFTENYSLDMEVSGCTLRIAHDAAANVCSQEPITISVVDSSENLVSFAGNINISTVGVTGGNWSKTTTASDANGALDNGAMNDGAAIYTFDVDDAGEIILNFQDNTAETVNFNIVAVGVTAPSGLYDPDLTSTACKWQVTHSEASDVCSIETVTITLADSLGVPVTSYAGTINLSTTSGFGTWSKTLVAVDAEGTLTDSGVANGTASYIFDTDDLGTITLNFVQTGATGNVNINVTDGVTLDPRNSANAFDKNIVISPCTIEISHSGSATACELEAVTFSVINSNDGPALEYTGTITLGTGPTNHGNWFVNDADGVLTETADDDNGVATYKFEDSDDGTIVLDFSNPHFENVNFSATATGITVDVAADPTLTVTSCLPTIATPSCVVGTSTTISIPAQNAIASQRGRMVLMVIAGASGAGPDATSVTFDSQPMTLIRQEKTSTGEGSVVEMWGMLDADLPAIAGSYTGAYSDGVPVSGMCLLVLDEVNQAFPSEASPATAGPLNSTQNGGSATIGTSITTTANNSLIVTASNMDGTTDNFTRIYADPSPDDVLTRMWGEDPTGIFVDPGNVDPFLAESRFGGAAGRQPTASIVNIEEELSVAGTSATQVVAAFEPLITGDAIAEGYVPVVLFQTFSGNMSYRAIGNTLRSTYNEDAPTPLGCNFLDFATGSEATLSLPVGFEIEAAYLYWFGSGDDALGNVDADVDFGFTGSEVPITADEIFLIDNVGNTDTLDYFTGYREVTDIVTDEGNFTLKNLTVQNGTPWDGSQACAGGWALVVVYEHEDERLRVLNLFHGFQPFQNSSFTLVPRNFRMETRDAANNLPNGQVTHITVEGDETLNAIDEAEGLGIQDGPGSTTFDNVTSFYNPLGEEFNSTVTRPVYVLDGTTGYFEFVPGGGSSGDGYDIDFAGPGDPRFGNTWGVDVDTHYFQGANPGEPLYDFAAPGSEAEQITTRYSAESDLVLLVSEVISITNFALADIEIFKTQVGSFTVNGTGTYEIEVQNNGNGSLGGGFADGEIIVADILPAGMTFLDAADVDGGADWDCDVTLDPGAFTCTYDIAADWVGATAGELAAGESLPIIEVTVDIGDETFFPFLSNSAENSARVLHSDGNCTPAAIGLIPDPASCDRAPQFDNYNDLQGGIVDINDLDDKQTNNNNVDSITTEVRGVEVDLAMDKFVDDILEESEPGVYTLRITNNGPDATTVPFTVTDTEPTGVTFDSASGGAGWSCPTPPGNLSCTYSGTLGVGVSTDITLNVTVTGAGGYQVSNTATVTAGTYNFDTVPGNNSDTDITEIVAAPVASNEKFLLSVSSLGETTTIGGLSFEDDDYIIYDPVTDTAEMFFDNSALGFDVRDADAVHLMKNGHIVISPDVDGSTVGSNNIAFDQGDLVVFDPILETARMLFDGSTIFGGLTPENVDINAVYLQGDCNLVSLYNCTIFFSATPAGTGSTIDGVSFDASDIIQYDLDTGDASLFFDGSTYFDDTTDITIDAFYTRVDPGDPDAIIDTLIISANDTSDDTITIGATVGWDPETGTFFTQDDVTEIDISGEATQNLFLGDVEFGIYDSTGDEADLLMDALHVVEDGYIGHFRVSEVGGSATVCSATGVQIRISKHKGLSHDRDLDYFGSIRLTTDTGEGDWVVISASGTLDNGTADDGAAIYTYTAADQGTVVLALNQSTAGTVNVDVSNGIAREGHPPGTGAEAPTFTFDAGVELYYADFFGSVSFGNQNGDNAWADNWDENDNTSGAAAGDVKISGGKLVFTGTGGTSQPSLARTVNLSGATLSSDLILNFDYNFASLGTFDELVVEARHSSAAAWQQVALYKRGSTLPNVASGSGASGNLNISAVLLDTPTATTEIRFRINQGYTLSGQTFSIDNVELTAETADCDVSPLGVAHYEINIGGITSGTYDAVACVGMEVTITAHDSGVTHNPVDPGNIAINLTTVPARGNWSSVISGADNLVNGTANNGAATYTFPGGQNSVTLQFDYYGPLTDPELFNISVTDGTAVEDLGEDPNGSVSQVGLRVLNTTGTPNDVTPIPLQIAGKDSDIDPNASVIVVQVVKSSDTDPSACEPLFAAGQTLEFEFAAECDDPTACIGGETFEVNTTSVPLIDNGDPINYTPVQIELVDIAGEPGAPIVINYSDVGRMRLLTRFDIPFGDDLDPLLATKSGNQLDISSNQFIVRPFGFDIDFDDGREDNGIGDASYAADHTGSRWKIAGESFNTTVSAVAWDALDDDSNANGDTANDGIPDSDADLSDNHVTPNFDQDSESGDYSVLLTVTDNKVIADSGGGILGELTSNNFDNFVSGIVTHTINYNEVGVIDIQATIVNSSDVEIPYLSTENVRGNVYNVGRFYPNVFQVTSSVLNSRADQACSPVSSFTYMDEDFEIDLALTAKGLTDTGGYTTVNYRGNYAKLDSFAELTLVAIDDVVGADDVAYTARLANQTIPSSFAATWNNGILSLSGNMQFARANPATPDGPYEDMQIAFLPTDDDGVTVDPERDGDVTGVLDVDIDVFATAEPGDMTYVLIDEHEFRYGRIRINNAYGPETEPLAITFDVEYFDGNSFVRNTLDDCTTISIADLDYVGGTYTGDLDAGETALDAPDTITVFEGQTQGVDPDLVNIADPLDSPFETSAPGEGNGGTVNVEFDLTAAGLEYLGFEWDDSDNDYNENPSAQLEFGQYRMHDRVINWQEIYNRPTP